MTIIKQFKESNRFEITLLLILISMFSLFLSVSRYVITDTKVFLFLNWNLFLAFIPWIISSIIILKGIRRKGLTLLLVLSWLLFFPNSPYILTDLFHLKMRTSAPIWFDLVVILSFAWSGLMFGFVSLIDICDLIEDYFSKKTVNIIVVLFLFLSAFGIYLGRFLRWNSWDIISNPFGLFNDIAERFYNPFSHPRTWGMTILMGILLNFMFFSFKFIKSKS